MKENHSRKTMLHENAERVLNRCCMQKRRETIASHCGWRDPIKMMDEMNDDE